MYTGPVSPSLDSDYDALTINTAMTPAETIATENTVDMSVPSSPDLNLLPYQPPTIVGSGHTFIIRSVSCGRVLTLLDGQVSLARMDSRGSSHWACVETKGWIGFQNPVSGKFLGYDNHGDIVCLAEKQYEWENFVVRQRREGGYFLLVTNWDHLWYIGFKQQNDKERLTRIDGGRDIALVWEFLEV